MGINIEFRTERGELVDDDPTIVIVEARDLPGFDDDRYPYLRLIDPYGNTVFSQYQVEHAVLDEVQRYASERPSTGIDLFLAMAHRCARQHRTALWLIGD
jgi:cation diffusion facilitator CzcD-associated flavoprotein CzcO